MSQLEMQKEFLEAAKRGGGQIPGFIIVENRPATTSDQRSYVVGLVWHEDAQPFVNKFNTTTDKVALHRATVAENEHYSCPVIVTKGERLFIPRSRINEVKEFHDLSRDCPVELVQVFDPVWGRSEDLLKAL